MAANLAHPATYIVAKYIPDIQRREPHNIGIILWAGGQVALRFAVADQLPYVNDQAIYARWTDHWRDLAALDAIRLPHRRAVYRRTPRFLQEMMRTQKGNYLLEEGGQVVDPVGMENIEEAADFLFEQLVSRAPRSQRTGAGESFQERCDAILAEAGLQALPDFQTNYLLMATIGEAERQLQFHYAIGMNGHPRALLLRVRVGQEATTFSAAFKFEHAAIQVPSLNRHHCFSLYESPDETPARTESHVDVLEAFSTPVNVAVGDEVHRVLRPLVQGI